MRSSLIALAAALLVGSAQAASPPPPADASALTAGANAFGVDFYRQLARDEGNIFVSPTSISTAFAMVYAGARGDTAAEMAKTMHYDLPADQFHAAAGDALNALQVKAEGRRLTVANALWVDEAYELLPSYLDVTRAHYGAGVKAMNFTSGPKAVKVINDWVADQTEQKIQNLFDPQDITGATKLVLTNTVYFKADWLDPFKKSGTHDGPFQVNAAKSVAAPMMNKQGHYSYAKGVGFQALSIPYVGDELAFVIVLPDDKNGLPALEKNLSAAQFAMWQKALKESPSTLVNLQLPRLKLEEKYQLNDPLKALGMKRAFSDAADFSGMSADGKVKIDKAVHQTYLAVDETGTEAAAATGITMRATAAMIPTMPVIFHADHPFLFWIEDKRSGAIVFMGRIIDPTA